MDLDVDAGGGRRAAAKRVLLYTPAIWQSAYTAESAFRAIATCIRSVLYEDPAS